MYNLYIPLCSLVLNIFLIILYLVKTSKVKKENNFYFGMIIDTFFITIFCIVAVYLLYIRMEDQTIIKIANKLECAFIFNFVANLFTYILYSCKSKLKKITLWYTFINFIAISAIFVAPVYLEVTNDLNYMVSVGPSVDITTVLSGIFLILTFLISLIHRKTLKGKIVPIILLLLFIILIVFIRSVIPELICLEFLVTLATLIMFHTIENPDIKLLNELAFEKEHAEKANNAKTEFLSSMSHEIRTPLNAIVGFSQALETEDIPDNIKEEIKDIVVASNSLLEIVNGILDISKIEANKLEIINTDYNFEKIFNELILLTKARIGDKNLEFRYSIDPTIPKVLYGDHIRIKQVILNILTNAVKYTKEGYIDFKVNHVIQGDICRLIISVEDTGIGIKNEKVDKLFQKFERLDVEKTITIEGTGLGLAITKRLVDLMKGQIVIQSVYGQGSKFTIALDQKVVKNIPEEIISNVQDYNELKTIDCTGKKILVVDDNNINLKVASRLLSEYKAEITSIMSGQECIDKINANEHYDLILMDDMMPNMSGTETLKILKNNSNFNIPTVVLTANAISGMKEKYISDGFNDYLSKPIEKLELNRVIIKFLGK